MGNQTHSNQKITLIVKLASWLESNPFKSSNHPHRHIVIANIKHPNQPKSKYFITLYLMASEANQISRKLTKTTGEDQETQQKNFQDLPARFRRQEIA